MALLLGLARRPLSARSLVPTAALYRPIRTALSESLSRASTTPRQPQDYDHKKATKLSYAERLALLPSALQVFHARHGHFVMFFHFMIPNENDSAASPHLPAYPEAARGLRLGTTLYYFLVNATSLHKHKDVVQALDAIGFPVNVDWRQYVWDHQRFPALRVYRELHGHLLVPKSYVVPSDDPRWPKETRGLSLGQYLVNLWRRDHQYLTQEQLSQLDGLGKWWSRRGARPSKPASPAAETDEKRRAE